MRIDGGSNNWFNNGPGGQRTGAPAARAADAGDSSIVAAGAPAPVPGSASASAAQDVPGGQPTSPELPPQSQLPPIAPGQRGSADDPSLFHTAKHADGSKAEPGHKTAAGDKSGTAELTPEQEADLADLRHRDAEVRAHEAAHAAAAGALGGGASFEYATGPDGRSYAVGGEVPVEMAAGHTPEETIRNAAQLRAAALAPAQPSAQDRAVAAEASAMEAAARAEIAARTTRPAPESGGDAVVARIGTGLKSDEPRGIEHPDPARVIQQLEVEQRTSRAGWRHLHTEPSCVICGQAVAAYR
jgi:hypothetical protein